MKEKLKSCAYFVHCLSCRKDPEFRRKMNLPDECAEGELKIQGVTVHQSVQKDPLPKTKCKEADPVVENKLVICKACEEYDPSGCLEASDFPKGTCGCRWAQFISKCKCPLNKW